MKSTESNTKIAIVTGGIKGIGKAITKKLLSQKIRVVMTYLNDDASAKKLQKDFSEFSENVLIFKSDISEFSSIQKLLNDIESKWSGPINYLVNNAGFLKQGDFFEFTEDDWNTTLDTNLKGPFFLSQEFLKRFNQGSIVNIASIGGQIGGDKAPHYAASKAGLISLTKSLARIGSQFNIRVNAVSPGWIETDIFNESQLSVLREKAKNEILIGRMGTPEEVADAVSFLLSDESSFITGHCLNVNGGMYLG